MPLHEDFYLHFIKDLESLLNPQNTSMLVAFSGGADSSVLLHLLHQLSKTQSVAITALHVHHGIRGEEADRDAVFAERFCYERNIPFVLKHCDVPTYAREHTMGFEEAARHLRYRILNEYCIEHRISYIVTAHNANDNAETVLFHLARGTALTGASGIARLNKPLLRPLLSFTKEEILSYADSNGIPYVVDSTNSDLQYTRNKIRHTVIPALESVRHDAVKAILRFSESARQDDEALYCMANDYEAITDTAALAKLPKALLLRVLVIKYRKIANNEISNEHLLLAATKIILAAQGQFSGYLSLPGKITLAIDRHHTVMVNAISYTNTVVPITLSAEFNGIFASQYRICVTPCELESTDALFSIVLPKSILPDITVRTRLEGDKYRYGKMTHKVKKLLCDYHIPRHARSTLPFFLYRKSILYIPGLPQSDLLKQFSDCTEERCRISVFSIKQ